VNKHRDRYYQGRRRGVPLSSHGQPAVLAFFALEKACEDGGKDLCVERRREYGPRGGKAFASSGSGFRFVFYSTDLVDFV
jgi:hypothetical protein